MKNEVAKKRENELESEKLVLKASRVSFLSNYCLAVLAIIFFILMLTTLDLQFTLLPKNTSQLFSTLLIIGVATIIAFLIEQPEIERWMRQYIVTENEVIEVEGIISKKKVILPYGSISEITVRRGPIGRVLNYGDVYIGAFRSGSDINMKGIRNAHKIHEIIQNKINLIREGQITFFGKEEGKNKFKSK